MISPSSVLQTVTACICFLLLLDKFVKPPLESAELYKAYSVKECINFIHGYAQERETFNVIMLSLQKKKKKFVKIIPLVENYSGIDHQHPITDLLYLSLEYGDYANNRHSLF